MAKDKTTFLKHMQINNASGYIFYVSRSNGHYYFGYKNKEVGGPNEVLISKKFYQQAIKEAKKWLKKISKALPPPPNPAVQTS